MKSFLRNNLSAFFLIALSFILLLLFSCQDPTKDDPSGIVDPEGTQSVSLTDPNKKIDNIISIVEKDNSLLFQGALLYLGAKSNLGAITSIPISGEWKNQVEIFDQGGYIAYADNKYCRLYVTRGTDSKGIIKYQQPFYGSETDILLDNPSLALTALEESKAVRLSNKTYLPLTFTSSEEWCSVSALSHNNEFKVSCTPNTSMQARKATITLKTYTGKSKTLEVTQAFDDSDTPNVPTRTITVKRAGTLKDLISAEDKISIEGLIVIGPIDDKDVRFICSMVYLSYLNMSQAEIDECRPYSSPVAIKDLSNIKKIIFPDKCTKIGGFYQLSVSSLRFPQSVVSISGFDNCKELTSISWPNNLKHLSGFSNCPKLKNIELPSSITTLRGFNGCAFESVTIPTQVTELEGLNDCAALKRVVLPKSLVEIEGLNNCVTLNSITLPESLVRIVGLNNCVTLNSITLPESLVHIMGLNNCTSLKAITLPLNIREGLFGSFNECSSLETVTIPSSVRFLLNTFNKCTSMHSVLLNEGLAYIGHPNTNDSVFNECTSLKTITIPSSVQYTNNAFNKCTSLSSVLLNPRHSQTNNAFNECSSLETVTIASKEIGYDAGLYLGDAFQSCLNLKNVHLKVGENYHIGFNQSFYPGNGSIVLYVPIGQKDKYSRVNYLFPTIIEE